MPAKKAKQQGAASRIPPRKAAGARPIRRGAQATTLDPNRRPQQ